MSGAGGGTRRASSLHEPRARNHSHARLLPPPLSLRRTCVVISVCSANVVSVSTSNFVPTNIGTAACVCENTAEQQNPHVGNHWMQLCMPMPAVQ